MRPFSHTQGMNDCSHKRVEVPAQKEEVRASEEGLSSPPFRGLGPRPRRKLRALCASKGQQEGFPGAP